MTTGGWNNTHGTATFNDYHYKNWSGADRPKVIYQKAVPYYIYRDGKRYRIAPRSYGTRPPKRLADEPHPYTMTLSRNKEVVWEEDHVDEYCNPRGFGYTHLTSSYRTNTTHASGLGIAQSQFTSNDQIKLVAKLREKLTGSDFNASVFLGESRQTLGLITDSATRIYRAMRSLKVGNIAHAANILTTGTARESSRSSSVHRTKALNQKTIGSAWLELQYGWLPLVKDAASAAEQLAHALGPPLRKRYSVSLQRREVTSIDKPKSPLFPCDFGWGHTNNTATRRTLIAYVKENMTVAATLGLLNPENVLWELTPWSFVVDWFIPIGQYLDARAITSCIVADYVTSTKTEFHISDRQGLQGKWDDDKLYGVFFERTVSSSPGLPPPAFKGLAKAASWQHCANSIALLTSGAWGSGSKRIR